MSTIRFDYPSLPVSVNKLYATVRGRKILSKEGRAWKTDFIARLGGLDPHVFAQFVPQPEAMYALDLWFYIDDARLFNLTFGVTKAAKSPFGDLDVSNLTKLAEDAISELVGIRDRNNFDVLLHKRSAGALGERLVAVLSPLTSMREGP